MSTIITGWLMYFLYSTKLVTDENIIKRVNHRESKCESCVLRKGNWCSKTKSVNKVIHIKKKYGSIKSERKIIYGCGCFLKAKYFVDLNKTKCPLNRWQL